MVLLAHSVVVAVFQNQEVLLLRQYDEEADLVCCEILFLAEELNLKDPEVYYGSEAAQIQWHRTGWPAIS